MALQRLTGASMLWPATTGTLNTTVGLVTMFTLDANTEQGAVSGQVWWPDRSDTSKDVSHVHFNAGAVASFGGSSQYRVSLQNVSTTAGPPLQPDGVVDQSFVSAAGTGPTATAWNRVALSTNRTVTLGEMVSVVFDFVTFTAADSIILRGLSSMSTAMRGTISSAALFTGSWADQAVQPALLLEFTDGTFGTVGLSVPAQAYNTRAFNLDTTGTGGGLNAGDERGLEFTPEVTFRSDGVQIDLSVASGADFEVIAYSGTTPLSGGTITVDNNATAVAGTLRRGIYYWTQELTFTAGTTYRVAVRPTTTNSVTLSTITLNDANHRVIYGGTSIAGNSRADQGAWGTPSTTEIPMISLLVSSLDDGTGSGGGGIKVNSGMTGGIRG